MLYYMYGYESTIDNDWHDDHCFSGFVRRDLEYDVKVGDIVTSSYGIGVVAAKALQHNGPLFRITFNAFPERTIWVRPWELEVISEGR